MKRPHLDSVDLGMAVRDMLGGRPGVYITMSVGQWDLFLKEGYDHQDTTLIELDENEEPIAAYRKIFPKHKHQYVQRVDISDRLRWHECKICKISQECDCDEETFTKRLKEGK